MSYPHMLGLADALVSCRPVPLEQWRLVYAASGWEAANPMPAAEA